MDEGFQFGCPRDRSLDPLVHGGNFAAHGLADGHDSLGCYCLRLGQTQRDFRHGTRGISHVLCPGHHRGEGEE